LTIYPSNISAIGDTIDPSVIIGNLVINLGSILARGYTVDPTVMLVGSASMIPPPVDAMGYTIIGLVLSKHPTIFKLIRIIRR